MSDTLQCSVLDDGLRLAWQGRELGCLLPVTVASPLHGTETARYVPVTDGAWQALLPRHAMRLAVRIHEHPRGGEIDLALALTEPLLLTALRAEIALPAALHLLQTGEIRIPLNASLEHDAVCYATTHELFPLRFSTYDADHDDRLLRFDRTCPYHAVSVRARRSAAGDLRPVVRVDRIGDEYGFPLLDAGTYVLFRGTLQVAPRQRPLFYYPRELFSHGQMRRCLLLGDAATARLAWTAANLTAQLPLACHGGKATRPQLLYLLPPGGNAASVPEPLMIVGTAARTALGLARQIRRLGVDLLIFLVDEARRPLGRREKIVYWLVTGACSVVKYDGAGNAVFLVRERRRIWRDRLRAAAASMVRQWHLVRATLLAIAGAPLVVPLLLWRSARK